jgi:predicted nicotinamide N-methyase
VLRATPRCPWPLPSPLQHQTQQPPLTNADNHRGLGPGGQAASARHLAGAWCGAPPCRHPDCHAQQAPLLYRTSALQGLDRAQTQAAEQVTVTLTSQQAHKSVTLKQNPTLLHAGSSTRVGAAVWDGAYVLAAWLDAQPPGSFAGLRCVELGCGLGLPGLVLARLGAAAVFLTDKPALLVGARGNAAKNKLLSSQPAANGSQQQQPQQPQQPGCVVQVVGLDWEQPESLAAAAATITAGGRVDLIVGSDCIYPGE